ncbi:flotillin domain-containing protein [Escherichia coli]
MQALPAVIEKSVEPMKSIDGIKIIQVDGHWPCCRRCLR